MRLTRPTLLAFLVLSASASTSAQVPQRDPQALALLQRALAAMGGQTPTDSVATGTVTLVEGSKRQTGSIRILTRGATQFAERIQTADESRALIYSDGLASAANGSTVTEMSFELASSQAPDSPHILVAATLANPDTAAQYLGLETIGGLPAHHLRFWNSYFSNQKLRPLAEFSMKDLWLDATSALPLELFVDQRAGGGAGSHVPLVVRYSDYRNAGGAWYPFSISKTLNGSVWATISIQQVALNTGLSDSDFPVQVSRGRK